MAFQKYKANRALIGTAAVLIFIGAFVVIRAAFFPPKSIIRVPEDYASVARAAREARSGSVILVSAGTYSDGITISDKTLTIRAEPAGSEVTIDSGGTPLEAREGASVYVEGLEFIARSTATNGGQGIRINTGASAELVDCDIVGSYLGGTGIDVRDGDSLILRDSRVYGGQNASGGPGGSGVLVFTANRVLIEDSAITGAKGGDATYIVGGHRDQKIQRYFPGGRGGFGCYFVQTSEAVLRNSTVRSGDGGDGINGVAPGGSYFGSPTQRWGSIALVVRRDSIVTGEDVQLIAGSGGRSFGFTSSEGIDGRELYLDTGGRYNDRTGDVTAWIMD